MLEHMDHVDWFNILATASSVVGELVENNNKIDPVISFVVVMTIATGLEGYQGNIFFTIYMD